MFICEDNISFIKTLEENSIDSCITDPPYGMNINGVKWDASVPDVDIWLEIYRVLKPGAFILSFCSPELYHRMAIKIDEAGFIPRDMLFWVNTTKMAKINKLKPAHEPIMVAQKPIEKTLKYNFEKWGTGLININEKTRIPWDEGVPTYPTGGHKRRNFGGDVEKIGSTKDNIKEANTDGRYPMNVIGSLDEELQKYFYAPRVTRKERGEYNDHPSPKPLSLISYLIQVFSPTGGIVIDPFCGSGTTGISCKMNNRQFICIDNDQNYINISNKRLEEIPNTLF